MLQILQTISNQLKLLLQSIIDNILAIFNQSDLQIELNSRQTLQQLVTYISQNIELIIQKSLINFIDQKFKWSTEIYISTYAERIFNLIKDDLNFINKFLQEYQIANDINDFNSKYTITWQEFICSCKESILYDAYIQEQIKQALLDLKQNLIITSVGRVIKKN